MVSSFPPTHCGIAAYAEQSVNHLRSQGHVVDVLSPDGQGNVDYAWDLRGGSKVLKLRQLVPYYDRVILQYVWSFYYRDPFDPAFRRDTLTTTLSFLRLFLSSRKIEVVAHEIPYLTGRARWLHGMMWRYAPHVVLHTAKERRRFEAHYGIRLADKQVVIREHHEVFQKFSTHTRDSARQRLGIGSNRLIFLCVGFIQRHKGFDRAMCSFLEAALPDARLYIVGSMRIANDENQRYLAELYELARDHANIKIVESFVSNEEFDTWITAADCVIFPYSEIWSSGVLARTRLLDRRAIVAGVGGLTDQAGKNDIVFSTDEELTKSIRTAALEASAVASCA
jgi:glycosyltransferase involved in cell wall biosynthesis